MLLLPICYNIWDKNLPIDWLGYPPPIEHVSVDTSSPLTSVGEYLVVVSVVYDGSMYPRRKIKC